MMVPQSPASAKPVCFSAWNTDPRRLPKGPGWENRHALPLQKLDPWEDVTMFYLGEAAADKPEVWRRFAWHEIGHFLATCALGYSQNVYELNLTPEYKNNRTVLPSHPLDRVVLYQAGQVMEHLNLGNYTYEGASDDDEKSRIPLKQRVSLAGRYGPGVFGFLRNKNKVTAAHLMQYPRATAELLVEILLRDRHWNQAQIQELVEIFKLDQVPTALGEV